jgi:hypothetical protein
LSQHDELNKLPLLECGHNWGGKALGCADGRCSQIGTPEGIFASLLMIQSAQNQVSKDLGRVEFEERATYGDLIYRQV